MAKNSGQPAGSRDTANTVGAPTGFLADEEHLDRAGLLRLGTWGVASVAAVVIAVLASQSSMKMRRDQVAAADLARQSQQIQSVAKESENETRRLASAIETLNADRDRLFSRMSTLEQGLDSVTGSIARQSIAAAAPQAPLPVPMPPPQPIAQNPAPITAPTPAPVVSLATATAAAAEKPRVEAKSPEPAPAPKAIAAAAPVTSAPPAPPEAPAAAPPMTSKSMMAPPDAAAGKLIEPEPPAKSLAVSSKVMPLPVETASAPVAMGPPAPSVIASPVGAPAPMKGPPTPMMVASVPPAGAAAADAVKPAPAPLTVKRTEFAVDVGGANSVGGLRALWRGLLKTRANAPLAALQPIIAIKEGSNGLGMQLRLVAGPLTDAAAAAKICATLIASQRPCETTVFDGQRLDVRAERSPPSTETVSGKSDTDNPDAGKSAAGKPLKSGGHRRSYQKRAVVEEPPKQPEPSTLSSFFGLRSAAQ